MTTHTAGGGWGGAGGPGGYGPPGGGGYGPPGGGGYGPPGGGGYGPPGGYGNNMPPGMGPTGPKTDTLAPGALITGILSLPASFCCSFFGLPLSLAALRQG